MSESQDFTLRARLEVTDNMSQGIRRSTRSLDTLRNNARRASQDLRDLERPHHINVGVNDRTESALGRIRTNLRDISSRSYNATVNIRQNGSIDRIRNSLSGVANNALLGVGMQMTGAAGMGYGLYDTAKTAMDFESSMSNVFATTMLDKTKAEDAKTMEDLTAKAMEMGAKTSFSASQSAEAFNYMAMAGWKARDMMNGIEGVMNLAAASGEDLGRVSDIVTDALTAFGLQAKDSGHFADVLAATASNANTNVGMLGYSFKYVAPLAGSLKYSVEDVNTALGLMANAGIKGEQSGSQLRNIITNLLDPNKNCAEAIETMSQALGHEFSMVDQATGKMKPFSIVMGDLRKAMAGMTEEQKAMVATQIAGKESMSGLLALVNASESDYQKMMKATYGAEGAAKKMADIKMDNLEGDIQLLASAWESLQITFSKGISGNDNGSLNGIRSFVKTITSYVNDLGDRLKDGFGFDDIVSVASRALNDLKKKFLAFDGIGSILAGGVLAGGILKIIGLVKKANEGLKGFFGNHAGGILGAGNTSSTPSVTDAVRNMTVNANSVVIKGRAVSEGNTAESETTTTTNQSGTRAGTTPPATQSWRNRATAGLKASKGTIAGGAALSAGINAMDYYGTVQNGKAREKEAQQEYFDANNEWFSLNQKYDEAKQSGASEETLKNLSELRDEAGARREEAKQNVVDTGKQAEQDNTMAAGRAIGGTVGTVALGALGAMFGGPAGAMIGATLGETIGGAVGQGLAGIDWSNELEYVKNGITNNMQWILGGIGEFLSGFATTISDGIAGAVSVIGNLPEWFESSVFEPISSGVSIAVNAISDGFDSALNSIKGAWSSLVSYFSSIFNSIAATASEKLSGIGSSISGFFGLGHNATGTSRWGGGFTEVNEHGGEIIDLPGGSRIYPHATTVDMISHMLNGSMGNVNPVSVPANVNITGNTFVVREDADINRIAYQIAEMMSNSAANYGGVY